MRILQASPESPDQALHTTFLYDCRAIAWSLSNPCRSAVAQAIDQNIPSFGFLRVGRDPRAALDHGHWMVERKDWNGEDAYVFPLLDLSQPEPFRHALARAIEEIRKHAWATRIFIADLQDGPFSGSELPPHVSQFIRELAPTLGEDAPQLVPVLTGDLAWDSVAMHELRSLVPQVGWMVPEGHEAPPDVLPFVQPLDALRFDSCCILTDARQDVSAVPQSAVNSR